MIFDYYGIHPTFKDHLTQAQTTLEDRISSIQNRFEQEIDDPRFKFRLQVHELEAYLFSSPTIMATHFNEQEKLERLNSILSTFNDNPELINDDPQTAPSKRLKNLFPGFGKTTDGIVIAEKTGISTIRERCGYFNEMCQLFDDLE